MDWDAVVDELYGLPPGDFTAARDERAKAARAAGDRELASRIRRLRRPTLAAWAGNLLVRERPDEVERLLELGAALRQAHQDLDGGQLRELSARQHRLTSALARQAGRLAARAGQRIGDDTRQEVQDTLHAVLADPEAAEQWAEGRLTKPLSAPVGFPALLSVTEAAPATRRTRPAGEVADLDAARVRRREQQEQLERARQLAADAEGELRDREDELAAAKEEQSRAEESGSGPSSASPSCPGNSNTPNVSSRWPGKPPTRPATAHGTSTGRCVRPGAGPRAPQAAPGSSPNRHSGTRGERRALKKPPTWP
ncbi:hypothetical protein AB0K74_23460 [Streptomyces sp. NPDC056159]|uniref:hypothetical protein n=1 Tax=unclassified Streptomyces TaxID=2593676 RepID=UPI00343A9207